jgi:hypothetical protein
MTLTTILVTEVDVKLIQTGCWCVACLAGYYHNNLNIATKWLSYKLPDVTHFVLRRGLLRGEMPQPLEFL